MPGKSCIRVPKDEALRGGTSDCRNRNLQKMFQFLGRGEQVGSGVSMIYQNWSKQHWREPTFEERIESNQTVMVLKMISLVPEPVIRELTERYGEAFTELSRLEQLILITAGTEEFVNHRRMKELVKDHPYDISQSLHALVEKGFLQREGSSTGTFYYLTGHHPMQDEMFGVPAGSLEHIEGSSEHLPPCSEHWSRFLTLAEPVRRSQKSPKELVESVILLLCSDTYLTLDKLSRLLGRDRDSLRNHYVNIMIEEGRMIQRFKNVPSHPKQGYMAVSGGEE